MLSDDDARLSEARAAVDAFVAELQAGVDTRDADVFNGHFAADVLWGTPFGDTVFGYDTLHEVHRKMLPSVSAERRRGTRPCGSARPRPTSRWRRCGGLP